MRRIPDRRRCRRASHRSGAHGSSSSAVRGRGVEPELTAMAGFFAPKEEFMATVIKIVELMGVSESSFDDAVRQAVKEAAKTIRNITGVEIIKSTAEVEGDEIFEYHVTVRLAFAVESAKSDDDGDETDDDESDDDAEEEAEE